MSGPRQVGRRPGDPAVTRRAILGAARDRFGSVGFDRATIRAIATQADVDPALVIHHFKNKQQLFVAAHELPLNPGELIVPEHSDLMAAIGAAHVALDEHREGRAHPFHGFGPLEDAVRTGGNGEKSLPPRAAPPREATRFYSFPAPDGEPTAVYLGVDVGSISTNLVLLDAHGRVVARRYLLTAGKPLDAVREGLEQIGGEIGGRLEVLGVGTTGSARHLVGQYVGADVVPVSYTHLRAHETRR